MGVTSKKQKIVGVEQFLNTETGELVPMQVVSVEDRDFNFHKVWMQHLIESIDSISNQKLRLAFWIIDHLNKENQLVMTQRRIAEESGMSLYTVTKTMTSLQEGDKPFLIKINSGAYQVNPDIIWKGSHNNRMGVVFDYNKTLQNTTETAQETPQSVSKASDDDLPLDGQATLFDGTEDT